MTKDKVVKMFQITGFLLLCQVGFSLATREEFHRVGNAQQLENSASAQETSSDRYSFVFETQNKKQLINEALLNENSIVANHNRIKRGSGVFGKGKVSRGGGFKPIPDPYRTIPRIPLGGSSLPQSGGFPSGFSGIRYGHISNSYPPKPYLSSAPAHTSLLKPNPNNMDGNIPSTIPHKELGEKIGESSRPQSGGFPSGFSGIHNGDISNSYPFNPYLSSAPAHTSLFERNPNNMDGNIPSTIPHLHPFKSPSSSAGESSRPQGGGSSSEFNQIHLEDALRSSFPRLPSYVPAYKSFVKLNPSNMDENTPSTVPRLGEKIGEYSLPQGGGFPPRFDGIHYGNTLNSHQFIPHLSLAPAHTSFFEPNLSNINRNIPSTMPRIVLEEKRGEKSQLRGGDFPRGYDRIHNGTTLNLYPFKSPASLAPEHTSFFKPNLSNIDWNIPSTMPRIVLEEKRGEKSQLPGGDFPRGYDRIHKLMNLSNINENIPLTISRSIAREEEIGFPFYQHLTTSEGENVTLRCPIPGHLKTKVHWYFRKTRINDVKLPKRNVGWENPRYKFDGHNLLINNITYEENGTFACEALQIGKIDTGRRIIDVTVHYKPYSTRNYTIYTKKRSSSIEVPCEVTANPPASYSWSQKVDGVYRIITSPSPDPVLRINFSNESQYGEYKCTAKNEIGYNDQYILFIPIEYPRPPKIELDKVTENFVTFKAIAERNGRFTHYDIEYKEKDAPDWKEFYVIVGETWDYKYKLPNLLPGTTYTLRVRSINELGRSAPSEEIKFTTSGMQMRMRYATTEFELHHFEALHTATGLGVRLTVSSSLLFVILLKWYF